MGCGCVDPNASAWNYPWPKNRLVHFAFFFVMCVMLICLVIV
jgi:hypothetical protein